MSISSISQSHVTDKSAGSIAFRVQSPIPCQIPLLRMKRSIKLPALNISSPPRGLPAIKTRGRSGSIVKVEQVGDRSTEEALDRSTYVNINADWVNAKGVHGPIFKSMLKFSLLHFLKVHG